LEPFSHLKQFVDRLTRWFDFQSMRKGAHAASRVLGSTSASEVHTLIRADHFIARVPLRGLTRDQIGVEITGHAIVIRGEQTARESSPAPTSRSRSRRRKRSYPLLYSVKQGAQSFRHEIALPAGSLVETARATFEDGLLEVSLKVEPTTLASGPAGSRDTSAANGAPDEAPSRPILP
jgi:HSP20 family molecular chaperone IbpA